MTELRRRMDDDMVVRGMAKRTRETYLAAVTGLAKFIGDRPIRSRMTRCRRICCTSSAIASGRGTRATSSCTVCDFCITRR